MEKRSVRKLTKKIKVGRISIGGDSPVSVQSMLDVPTTDIDLAIAQIYRLESAGCDIVRLAIRDFVAVEAFAKIRKSTEMPLVADIHFDYRLAISAIEAGADKIRINPGNIGTKERVREVAETAKSKDVPIRIGVNAGSLPENIAPHKSLPEKMLEAAIREISILEEFEFTDIVVSMKSHDIFDVIEANRLFSERFDYPLHLGVTEAGLPPDALIKGSLGIGALLVEGIGDTIRFSITGDPVEEVIAGKDLLQACHLHEKGIELVSCPVCGRCRVDLANIAAKVKEALPNTERKLVVAVMGCEVNGPGEAKNADIGIAGGDNCFFLFKDGVPIKKVSVEDAVSSLLGEIYSLLEETR